MTSSEGRPSADEVLDRVRREAGAGARGRHHISWDRAGGWARRSPRWRSRGAEPIRVIDRHVARALMRVAHDRNVGSIVVGHSHHGRLHQWMHGSVVHALWRPAADVGVHVVAARGPERH